jgi:AAA+ ATPase superfamily predicted ATPase
VTRFYVGKPAPPEDLMDRKEEVRHIVTKMKARGISYNLAILGYRRIGKTSILLKAREILSKRAEIAVVYFDVKENMAEPKTFLTRLEKAIFDAYLEKLGFSTKIGTKASKATELFTKIREALTSKKVKSITANISSNGIILPKIEFEDKVADYSTLFLSVFKSATAFAEKSNLKFIVILDEFQDLSDLDRYPGLKDIFGLFRSVIQQRGKTVSFIVSGSRVHMLQTILGSGESPLFVHFERYSIQEMDRQNSLEFFNKYLAAKKLKPSNKAAEQAYELVGGQPFYLMAIAEKWNHGDEINSVFQNLLTDSLGTLRLYAEYILSEDLSDATGGPILKTMLQALSGSSEGYTVSELAKRISVSLEKLPRYLKPLVDADLVTKTGGRYTVRDKMLREYLRMQAEALT